MNWVTATVVYLLIWWVVLFAVLPWGVRSQEEAGEVAAGTERGAPAVPRVWLKLAVTSAIAAVLFALVAGLILSGVFSFAVEAPWS